MKFNLLEIQLNVKYITFLGHLDLKWVAKKLEERGLAFWAKTFEHFSECARIMEEDADNWQALPIFGGTFQNNLKIYGKGGGTWLSLRDDNPNMEQETIDTIKQYFNKISAR